MSPEDFPLIEEIPYCCPLALFAQLPRDAAIFLDSALKDNAQGRFSFIGVAPFQVMICKAGAVQVGTRILEANPFDVLAQELQKYSLPRHPDLPPFQGGVAGMLGYELGGYLENIPQSKSDDLNFPEMILGFYDLVVAFDHQRDKTWIFSSGFPENDLTARFKRASERMTWLMGFISNENLLTTPIAASKAIISTFNQQTYENAVAAVIAYIRAGDIFEANISQRFSTELQGSPFDLYCKLRMNNPAPFAAYLQYADWVIASASPERFLRLTDNQVQARPIKGTRSRFSDPDQDQMSANELINSEKDWAENVMIVDLMRNDLSRVCLAHTIKVPQLCALESFRTVHHLVSVVEGVLAPENKAIDLLKATFPGGSITGAPKIRAMEIIAEIEPTHRGPYCGSMGYIGFNGDMDLSITIRSYAINKTQVTFQTGGAVTVDSDPKEEYEETLVKAKALSRTLLEP